MTTHTDNALTFGIDAALGSVKRVGDLVIIRSEEPVAVWDAVTTSIATSESAPADVAEELAERGVTVEITSSDGLVARLGAGADSARGRLVTGSRKVELGDRIASSGLVRARLRRGDPRLAAAGVGAVAAAVAVVTIRRRHRRKSVWEIRRDAATENITALISEVRSRGQEALPVLASVVDQARAAAAPHVATARVRVHRDVVPVAHDLSARFQADVVPAARTLTDRGLKATTFAIKHGRHATNACIRQVKTLRRRAAERR